MMQEFYIITFSGTHVAMRAEQMLNSDRIPCKIVPLPTSLSAGCGFAIRMDADEKIAIDVLCAASIECKLYHVRQMGLERTYTRCQ